MATKVLKELAVVVSTYEDRSNGQTKNRYKNIGVMMESTNDKGEANTFLMLDRSFNPAGIPFKPNSDKIMISMFDPKPRDGQSGGQTGSQGGSSQSSGQQSGGGYGGGAGGGYGDSVSDDEIPF